MRGAHRRVNIWMVVLLVLVPTTVWAQADSNISGVVKDGSGAVMPGVTVEASSPVLLEKVRTVVTDGDGQYKIVTLPSGVYTVTFSLTGFNTVKRDGIALTPSFTATINADLTIGSVQETVTVSGASPVVDVQNLTQRQVFRPRCWTQCPSSRTSWGSPR